MQEKNQNDQSHCDTFFQQFFFEVFHRAFDERRTVIDSDNFNPVGQAALKVCKFGFDTLNNRQCVLAVAHDDDPGNRFALAVQLNDASAKRGPLNDPRNGRQQDRRTVSSIKNDLFEIGLIVDIA